MVEQRPIETDEAEKRSKWFTVAVGVTAGIVGLFVWVIWPRSTSHHVLAPVAHVVIPSSGGCHLPDTDQTVPTSGPKVIWTIVGYIDMPSSASAGPQRLGGGVAQCFAHTPVGALVASVQIEDRVLVDSDWRQQVDTGFAPGPGVSQFIEARAAAGNTPNEPGEYCQMDGFSFLGYSPTQAQIEEVSSCGGRLQAVTVTMRWLKGDWLLVTSPAGDLATHPTIIANLTGFEPWGGI